MTYYKHDASGEESLTSRKMRTIRKRCRAAGDVFVFLREEAARQQKGIIDFCSDDELEYVFSDLLIEKDEWEWALELLGEAGFILVDGYKIEIANWEGKQSEYLQRKSKKSEIKTSSNIPTLSGQYPDNVPTVSGEHTDNNGTISGGCRENVSSPLLSYPEISLKEKIMQGVHEDVALKMKWRALTGAGLATPIVEVMRKFKDWDNEIETDLTKDCPPKDRVAWADILADLRKQLGTKWAEMILTAKGRLEQDPDMKRLNQVSIYYLFNLGKGGGMALTRIREWAGKKPIDPGGNGKIGDWVKFRDYIRCECGGLICGYKRNNDGRSEAVIRCDACGKNYRSEELKQAANSSS